MDERARRSEREAAREGSAGARLRLAHEHLRGGRWAEALEAVEALAEGASAQAEGVDAAPAEVRAGALAVRALAWLRRGDAGRAVAAAQAATALDPLAVDPAVGAALAVAVLAGAARGEAGRTGDRALTLAALRRAAGLGEGAAPALAAAARDPSPWVRAQAARLPSLAAGLAHDASALVRAVARGAAAGDAALRAAWTRDPSDPPRTRLFSAHGPDFEFGGFLVVDASTEARLQAFDAATWADLDRTLGAPGRTVGFSSYGYGLALSPDEARGEWGRRALEDQVAALEEARAVPCPLRVVDFAQFDVVAALPPAGDGPALAPVDAALARAYASDLAWHPARHHGPPPGAGVYARVCAAFGPGQRPEPEALAALLEAGRREYAPAGAAALEAFVARARATRPARATTSAERTLGRDART